MSVLTVPTHTKAEFISAVRINYSLTASVEKCVLHWLAVHAPRWVTSDRLTILGFAAQIAAGACYALARFDRRALLLVILCLVFNWLGDSLDGTLARVRQQQRPRYGFYVDHVVDIFGATALMAGLGCSGLVHWPIAAAMLVAFLLLSGESYLATYTLSRFQLSQGIFGPTEIRILLAIGNLVLLRSAYTTVFGHRILLFDIAGGIASLTMLAMVVATAARHTTELYRLERL